MYVRWDTQEPRSAQFQGWEVSALQAQGHLCVPDLPPMWQAEVASALITKQCSSVWLSISSWRVRSKCQQSWRGWGLLTACLLLWQVLDGTSFVPKDSCKVKRRVRIPDKPNYSLNLWSIMKNCIGRELSRIPMPVGTAGQESRGSWSAVHVRRGGCCFPHNARGLCDWFLVFLR